MNDSDDQLKTSFGSTLVKTNATVSADVKQRRDRLITIVDAVAPHSKAANTWRAYESSWRAFLDFCDAVQLSALPAEPGTVVMFLAQEYDRGLARSTIEQRLAAIRFVHIEKGLPSPHDSTIVKNQMAGIKQLTKDIPLGKKAPATDDLIIDMVRSTDQSTLKGQRDRTVLLYGHAGAFRRSELVAIDVEHIERVSKGHLVTLPNSKGKQTEKKVVKVAILKQNDSTFCPVNAMEQWLSSSNIRSGAVFPRFYKSDRMSEKRMGDKTVERIVQESASMAGYKASEFAGHSLRSGFLTSAAERGARWDKLMGHARHKRFDTTAGYIVDRELFRDHPGEHGVHGEANNTGTKNP